MTGYLRWLRFTYNVVAWLFAAGVAVQVYLAGFGIFAASNDFGLHRNWGYLLGLVSLAYIVLAVLARPGRRIIGATVLILLLIAMQSVFVGLRGSVPAFSALHPLNGFLILFVALAIAWSTRSYLRGRAPMPAVLAPPQSEPAADTRPA